MSTQVITRTIIEEYKNSNFKLTQDFNRIYQSPQDRKASIVLLCHVSNTDTLNNAEITIQWRDYSNNNKEVSLLTGGNVPAKASLNILESKLILEPMDSIWAKANYNNRLDLTLSILEVL